MSKFIRIFLLLGLIITATIATEVEAASSEITVLRVKGTINPVLVDYIERGVGHAEPGGALVVVVVAGVGVGGVRRVLHHAEWHRRTGKVVDLTRYSA